ncbi:MAG: hypothetical protein MZV64_17125 [Ignavibacteriales bacterium]|nr:hypothetical protein [Ignavibacteriales bacterium]
MCDSENAVLSVDGQPSITLMEDDHVDVTVCRCHRAICPLWRPGLLLSKSHRAHERKLFGISDDDRIRQRSQPSTVTSIRPARPACAAQRCEPSDLRLVRDPHADGVSLQGMCQGSQQNPSTQPNGMTTSLDFAVAAVLSGIASFLVTSDRRHRLLRLVPDCRRFTDSRGAHRGERCGSSSASQRSRNLFITIAAGVVVGALPILLFQIFSFDLFGVIFQVIYLLIATPVVYTRLSGSIVQIIIMLRTPFLDRLQRSLVAEDGDQSKVNHADRTPHSKLRDHR